ncbi:MAG: hypothetical protein H6625_07325 [Bdellovibrionaceae bacterium]|nr:hypothetical protein [Pseudobdellovibrionaceae bacterium]
MVLSNSKYPDVLSLSWKVNYNSENKTLVIDYELPASVELPLIDSYKFVRAKNKIEIKPLPTKQAKELYDSILFQICIRTIHEIFEADLSNNILSIAFNGSVTTLNEASGNEETKVIMSILTSKEIFNKINLSLVNPEKTFQHLNGISGKSLYDFTAVTPVLAISKIKKSS